MILLKNWRAAAGIAIGMARRDECAMRAMAHGRHMAWRSGRRRFEVLRQEFFHGFVKLKLVFAQHKCILKF